MVDATPEPKETAVAVKGLAPAVDEPTLTTMFGAHGKLLRVKMDHTGGAHVVFASTRAAQRAAASLNGAVVQGQPISAYHVRTFAKTARPCRGFQQGICRKGDQCKYWHPTDGAAAEVSVVKPTTANKPTIIPTIKTKKAATVASAVAPPAAAFGDDISGIPKHSICRNFAKGKCVQGESCRFAHVLGAGALPPPAPASIPAQCSFYAAGRCTKGDECAFLHTDRPPQPPSSKPTMCSFFAAGRCARGDQCAYIHESKPSSAIAAPVAVPKKSVVQATAPPVVTKAEGGKAVKPPRTPVPPAAVDDSDRTCIECEKHDIAKWVCPKCDNAKYCDQCKTLVHRAKVMRSHAQEQLPTLVARPLCGECEAKPSSVQCQDCDVSYCPLCDACVHQFKSLRNHTRTPLNAASAASATKTKATETKADKPAAAPSKVTVSEYVESVPQYDLPSDSESTDDEEEDDEPPSRHSAIVVQAPVDESSSDSEEDEEGDNEEDSPAAAALAAARLGYVESVPTYTLPSASESSDSKGEDDENAKDSIVKAAAVDVKQKIAAPAGRIVTPQTLSSESSDSDDDDFEDERPVVKSAATLTRTQADNMRAVTTISSESESDSDDEDVKPKPKTTPASAPAPKRKANSTSSSESDSSDDEPSPPPPKQQRVAAAPVAAPRPRPAAQAQDRKAGISTGSSHSLVKKIEAYEASDSSNVLHLDPNLNGFERLLAHDCAERLGLAHVSVGEGLERHITVSRRGGGAAAVKRRGAPAATASGKKQKRP